MPTDPRYVVGNFVEAFVHKVTHRSEASRRFGADWNKTKICGIIVNVVQQGVTAGGRPNKLIEIEFDLGDNCKKRKLMTIRMVTHVAAWYPPPVSQAMQMEVDNQNQGELVIQPTVNTNDHDEVNNDEFSGNLTDNPDIEFNNMSIEAEDDDFGTDDALEAAPEVTTTTVQTPQRRQQATITSPRRDERMPRNGSVVASPNNMNWFFEPQSTRMEINGPVRYREWHVKTPTNENLFTESNRDERYSRLDIFLLMFPPRALDLILYATNEQLEEKGRRRTTKQEILKFFGIIILSTRYEFTSRASLWSTEPPSKYEPAPAFGRTGMGRVRFDELWNAIRFSHQPQQQPPSMSSEQYRWSLVDGFVDLFNKHRAASFIPSDLICVDESISRWYGQGGNWINHGLPMYVCIDRKPENGCEIQDAACGRSGVMIQLRLVKTANEAGNDEVEETEEQIEQRRERDSLLHGTRILKELVLPWQNSERLICADSYFSSVGTVDELRRMNLRFIGVVKTATKRFPMKYLSRVILGNRGDRHGVVAKDPDGNVNMLAFVWMDRDRRYFIASAGSLAEGEPNVRTRWRQLEDDENAPPTRVTLTVPQPKATEVYYSVCSKVDQHNRSRQAFLDIEKKLVTTDWSLRVNLSILSIIIIDTWKVYSQLTFPVNQNGPMETQKQLYARLAAELIDNRYDVVRGGSRQASLPPVEEYSPVIDRNTGEVQSGIGPRLTPTKKRQKDKDGNLKPYALQGRCKVCKDGRTTHECSICRDKHVNNPWICYTKNGSRCYVAHMAECHPNDEYTF